MITKEGTLSSDTNDHNVVICGDSCINIILQIPKPLQRGSNVDITHMVRRPGGNALVTAMALSKWGIRSSFLGVVGSDYEGTELRSWLSVVGVDDSTIVVRNIKTRIAYAIVDSIERTVLDLREPSIRDAEIQPEDWKNSPQMEKTIRQASAVMVDRYCSAIHALIKTVFTERRRAGEKPLLAYRTGSRTSDSLLVEAAILPYVDIAFTKSGFLQTMGLGSNPVEACRMLAQRYHIPVVVATLGEDGAAYYNIMSNENEIVSAIPIGNPSTTLGAGDFFRAGFLIAYLGGKSVRESVEYGNVAAAIHCGRIEVESPTPFFFSKGEVDAILKTSQTRTGRIRVSTPDHAMRGIFLSYKDESPDKEIVSDFAQSLQNKGLNVWWDKFKISSGESIPEQIGHGLSNMDIFIPFLSQHSVESGWVKKELNIALTKMIHGEVRVIPILLEKCEVPELLKDVKYINCGQIGRLKAIQELIDII